MDKKLQIINLEPKYIPEVARLYLDVFNSPPWNDSWTLRTAEIRLREEFSMPGFIGLIGKHENITVAAAFGFTVQDDNNMGNSFQKE